MLYCVWLCLWQIQFEFEKVTQGSKNCIQAFAVLLWNIGPLFFAEFFCFSYSGGFLSINSFWVFEHKFLSISNMWVTNLGDSSGSILGLYAQTAHHTQKQSKSKNTSLDGSVALPAEGSSTWLLLAQTYPGVQTNWLQDQNLTRLRHNLAVKLTKQIT